MVERPHCRAVRVLLRLAGVIGPNLANTAWILILQPHDSCGRHWQGVMKVLAYLSRTRSYSLAFNPGEGVLQSIAMPTTQ